MVGSLLRHTQQNQNTGPQDIIWSMPTLQVTKPYSFYLKIQMDIAPILEWSCKKLAAPSLPFSCSEEKKSLSFNTEKLHQHHMHMEMPKSTFKYHAVSGQKMRNNCKNISKHNMKPILNRFVVTVDKEKQFSVRCTISCPKLTLLLTPDFHKIVSGFGLFCSGKSSFLFKLQLWNFKEKLRWDLGS